MGSCPKQGVGIQIAEMKQKMEDTTAENKLLRQELCMFKEAHRKEIEDLKRFHENDTRKVKEAFQEIHRLKGQIDELKQIHQRKLVALEEECTSLRTRTVPLPLPPFYVLMRNVNYYTEHGQAYSSEPLYSHPGGYKMNIVVYARNPYLSVGMTIIRGEFDDQLKWPFDGKVTVQAYNRTQRQWCAELTVALNRRVCSVDVVRKRVIHFHTDVSQRSFCHIQSWNQITCMIRISLDFESQRSKSSTSRHTCITIIVWTYWCRVTLLYIDSDLLKFPIVS
jgi:hypothetical protein